MNRRRRLESRGQYICRALADGMLMISSACSAVGATAYRTDVLPNIYVRRDVCAADLLVGPAPARVADVARAEVVAKPMLGDIAI